jgi:tetratricopeptide (TPR) repeat protein
MHPSMSASRTKNDRASPGSSPFSSPHTVTRKELNSPLRTHRKNVSSVSSIASLSSQSASSVPSGVTDSIPSLERALRRRLHRYGPHHVAVSALYNRLGNIYFRQGHLSAAKQAYQQAAQGVPGQTRAAAFANLGTVYWSMGHLETAVDVLHQALGCYETDGRFTGEPVNKVAIANTYHQLGLCYALMGRYEYAMIAMDESEEILIQHLGKADDDAIAKIMDARGKIYLLQGALDKAQDCHEQSLQIYKHTGGSPISTLNNMATVYATRGDEGGIAQCLSQVWKVQKEQLSKLQYGTAGYKELAVEGMDTLQRLLHVYHKLGVTSEVERCEQEVRDMISQANSELLERKTLR